METVPDVTIFVRHSAECKYRDDETWKRCNCRKHFRWFQDGRQNRRKAGTRSWSEAELRKHDLVDELMGRKPASELQGAKLLDAAIESFQQDKNNQGLSAGVLGKYDRELDRLRGFAAGKGVFTVAGLTRELLIEYQSGWMTPTHHRTLVRWSRRD